MTPTNLPTAEDRFDGVREVLAMAGPIMVGSMSFVIMDFMDKYMVAQLGTEQLAAIGSSSIWAFLMSTLLLGIVGCISTFVGQSVGRNDPEHAGAFAWQGFYVSLLAGASIVVLWPGAVPLFQSMGHSELTTRLETEYFQLRLLGYFPLAWSMALAAFFQAINRPRIQMWVMIVGNMLNIALNYVLIFGHFGVPAMGIAGAAWGTVISQVFGAAVLHVIFLLPEFDERYHTRRTWRFDYVRFKELVTVGFPAGVQMLLDIATWGVFISYIIGQYGDKQLAANNAALSLMMVSFMPAVALNQVIAPIVGQWIGRGNFAIATARTYTAIKIAAGYMLVMGVFFAGSGYFLMGALFTDDPEIMRLGWELLICAAIFQSFDGVQIVCVGALRGAGDTKWVMWATAILAYPIFLPIAFGLAYFGGGALGAWMGATVYIIFLSGMMLWRFNKGVWKTINIFAQEEAVEGALPAEAE